MPSVAGLPGPTSGEMLREAATPSHTAHVLTSVPAFLHHVPAVVRARQRMEGTSGSERSRLPALAQITWRRGTRLRVVEERQACWGSRSMPTGLT